MIDRRHDLSIVKQAEVLNISRGSVYYLPRRPVSETDLAIMRRLDRLHLDYPFAGSRMLCHKIYPYLLRGIEIMRPNQVWAMDITYIPMARGFVYLAVVLDWFSRRV